MPIKLAFSTVACPEWPLDQVIAHAKAIGYQGVELRTLGPGSGALACEPALSEPKKVHDLFKNSGVEPVCLSTSLALHYRDDSKSREAQRQITRNLELAAAIGCPSLRIFGNEAEPGQNRREVIQRIAERVTPLMARAGELGVQILFENSGGFTTAKEWWWLLNIVDHPLIGLCWNVANAAAAGEPPSVSVPTLHSRIRLAKVTDAKIGEGGFVPLGEGTVGIEQFVKRLLGIGYDGYISVEWDRLWLPALTPAEEYLPDAYKRLQGWLDEVAKSIEDAKPKPKPAKVAAKEPAPAVK